MGLDIAQARADTPGCKQVAHLNNAGAALPPRQVTDAVIAHLRAEEAHGGYEAAATAAPELQDTYDALGDLLGAAPDEIAVVENATRAFDMAFYSLPVRAGQRLLTGRAEYASNALALLQVARRTGAQVEVVGDDEHGRLDLADLAARLSDTAAGEVALVTVPHVPTQSGLVNPAADIGALCRSAGVPFLLDACQSAGQLPLDVGALGCDVLSGTGRKWLRGPRGTGFLYVRRALAERLEPPFLDLRAAEWVAPDRFELAPGARRFETWEGNVAAKIGLGVAARYALGVGVDAIAVRVGMLAASLREALGALPGVRVHDRGLQRCGIVSFTVAGRSAGEVAAALAAGGVNVSVSGAGAARLDLPARGLEEVVRASPHYYNTEEELDRLCAAVPPPRVGVSLR